MTITPGTSNATHQVTLISENISIPPFSGNGSESVQSFIRRIDEECTRRAAQTDPAKLAILKARICYEPSSLVGKLVKSDKFLSLTKYDDFTNALHGHFSGHSKLGASHSFLKIAETITHVARSTSDVYKAENVASSLSSELIDQMKNSQWTNVNDSVTTSEMKRLMSYLIFLVQLDQPTFAVASEIKFNKNDFLYDVCKQISEKSPPSSQTISTASAQPVMLTQHSSIPTSDAHVQPSHSPLHHHSRGRSQSRSRNHTPHRQRPTSSFRVPPNVTCYRCGIKGHVKSQCRVNLQNQTYTPYNGDAFCALHNARGHTLEECRVYQRQLQSLPHQSKNESRHSLHQSP